MTGAVFEPNLSVLPQAQQHLWSQLAPLRELGFVLYGGTAIALRLGHRQSIDFDFFREASIDADRLVRQLPFLEQATTLQNMPDTLVVSVPVGSNFVKVSFFGGLSFGRVADPQITQDGVVEVASLDDLMAMKVKVILQRAEARDYIDIAHLLRAGVSLERGLSAARRMFQPTFQPSESLKALTYFSDGNLSDLATADQETLVAAATAVGDLPDVRIQWGALSLGVSGKS